MGWARAFFLAGRPGDAPHPHRRRPRADGGEARRIAATRAAARRDAVGVDQSRRDPGFEYGTGGMAEFDARKVRVVELRYFLGCTADEAADVLGISKATVDRESDVARAWLFRRLRGETRVSE